MSHTQGTAALCGIDNDYWKKRLCTLEQNYDLVVTQRRRIAKLLALLERNGNNGCDGGLACPIG